MIQRIQSIYLFAALLLVVLLFFVPYAEVIVSATEKVWLTLKNHPITNGGDTVLTILRFSQVTAILSGVLLFVCIFLYKNRKLQMKICTANMVLLVIQTIILFAEILFITSVLKMEVLYRVSLIFPLIGLILVYLAYWGIKKDDELVRSLNRIR